MQGIIKTAMISRNSVIAVCTPLTSVLGPAVVLATAHPVSPLPLSESRLCGVEGVDEVLDADSLACDQHASVAANGCNERSRPAVLVDDHHGRLPARFPLRSARRRR